MPAVRRDPNPSIYASSIIPAITWKANPAFPATLCGRFQPQCCERFLNLHSGIPRPSLPAVRVRPSASARICLEGYDGILRLVCPDALVAAFVISEFVSRQTAH